MKFLLIGQENFEKVMEVDRHGNNFFLSVGLKPKVQYPLTNISITQIKTQAFSWAELIQQHPELSALEKVNILSLLGGFISHRIQNLNLDEVNQLLGGFKMEDTQVGKDLIEIGVKQGISKGKHQVILSLLSYKFKTIPEDVLNRINEINEDAKLDEIALKTLELTNREQLKKILN